MIPNRIIYCWFGGKPKPKEVKKCIKSWKHYCRNFEIVEYNETNFDIGTAPLYVRQAYQAKKWAFVSDYVRVWAMYHFGGVYLDTDVELLKSVDPLLHHSAFAFYETEYSLSTGLLGCERNFTIFGEMLERYEKLSFVDSDESLNMTTNVTYFTDLCTEYGFNKNNTRQNICGLEVYPTNYLFSRLAGRVDITSDAYGIHYFSCSWMDKERQLQQEEKMSYLKKRLRKERAIRKIKNLIRSVLK